MIERISVEQLQELTEEQKEKLREWWTPKYGDMVFRLEAKEIFIITRFAVSHPKHQKLRETFKKICLPLLSIGQMIELLKELAFFGRIQPTNTAVGHNWMVILFEDHSETWEVTEYYGGELIDALWEAVKEVL